MCLSLKFALLVQYDHQIKIYSWSVFFFKNDFGKEEYAWFFCFFKFVLLNHAHKPVLLSIDLNNFF